MHWTLQNIVWTFGIALEFVVTASVLHQRLWQTYPAFVTYLAGEIVRSLSLRAIGIGPAHYATYFYTYWITECILVLQGFVVVREVFSKALSDQFGQRTWGARLFWWSLAILIAIGAFVAVDTNGIDPNRLVATIFALKRAESLVRVGLIAALFIFVFILGLRWSHPAIGIAAGMGIYAAGELAEVAVRASLGRFANNAAMWTSMGIGAGQNIFWIAYFAPWRRLSATTANVLHGAELEIEKLHSAIEVFLER